MRKNQLPSYGESLASKFPEIAKEWCYEKNGNLIPETTFAGSHKEVFWKCAECGQIYKMKVCNRTAPSRTKRTNKCPICLGRIVIPGFNSLKAKFSELVKADWDYELNTVDPDTIPPRSNKKYWWHCSNGHKYQASVNNKTSQTGGNCPYCSHQKLTIENSLAMQNPELAKEWDYDKNTLTPYDISAYSGQKVWWKCINGHSWQAKVSNRNNGRGCPECSKGKHSSFPELVIYYYVKLFFPDAINGAKIDNMEIDIFIPSIKIGIEYDGEYYHNSQKRITHDLLKNKKMQEHNIHLIRIREDGCPTMNSTTYCTVFTFKYLSNYSNFRVVIEKLLLLLSKYTTKEIHIEIDIDKVKNNILRELSTVPKGQDLLSINPTLSKEWDYKLNYPLTPSMVLPKSSKKVFWKCSKCGYIWESLISSRNKGYGCPKCAKRQHYTTKEWIEAAKRIHGTKYDYTKSIYINSKTPITITCKIHGDFHQLPSEHLQGKGCKYCAKQAFHVIDSLANKYPDIASEWDYELNQSTGFTPQNIGIDTTRLFYWHCNNGKNHSYKATIASRVYRHSKCAICHGKQIDYTTSVAYLYPELAKEWCEDNIYNPTEVSVGSEKKIKWKCANPDHKPYFASVYARTKLGSKCPECSGNIKSPQSYKKEVVSKFPTIELLSDYKKSNMRISCRCKLCGYEWQPFPFNLLRGKGCPKCKNELTNCNTSSHLPKKKI